ncbi:hypothetical protein [Thiolapillus sp.]|uniref:hypothetical protein n=1 Tax=Thiolapillus sp. TaxID=2017437 RepID=UPI003AF8A33E
MRPTVRIEQSGDGMRKVRKHLHDVSVEVGILRGKYKAEGDEPARYVAQVAAQNEYGHGRIPSRPFLRNAMRKHKKDIRKGLRRVAQSEMREKPPRGQMMRLGMAAQNWVRREITDLRTPPNAPMTIARKRSSNPLIDTGRMRQEIQFRVLNKSGQTI